MSVLIKGMEKPEHCGYCRFRYDGICHALQKTQYSMDECPLVVIDDVPDICVGDTISRQAALNAMDTWDKFGCDPDGKLVRYDDDNHYVPYVHYDDMVHVIKHLPSAQAEIKPIEYRDCANAMLRMWMDGVVTDGEYGRIMDKLNSYWRERHAHVPG